MRSTTALHSGRRPAGTLADRCRTLRDDERGMSLVFIGVGFMSFFVVTTLAIDVGMFMTARTQAQTSADAGALAGATALAFNSFTDHSSVGPAVTSAINAAQANTVMGTAVSITSADVTFPFDAATGESDQIHVSVYRTTARGNALPTLVGRFFGVTSANIQASATAQAAAANAARCVLPFTIPDKWIEKTPCGAPGCSWTPSSTFDMYDNKGNFLPNPDIYNPPGSDSPTGYSPTADVGLQLTLKASNGSNVAPSMYNPWDLPGSTGGDDYRNNISGCNSNLVTIGNDMAPENGNMVGPTQQGTQDLIASDPGAHWDTGCNCVKGSAFAISPRIRIAPLYDPAFYAAGKASGKSNPQLRVVNYLGFFIEDVKGGGDVIGRIAPALGEYKAGGPSATGGFARALMVVQ
jgi:hypothetical protein